MSALIAKGQAGLWTPGGAVYGFGGPNIQINFDGASSYGNALRIEQYQLGNSDGPKINFYKAMSSPKNWTMGILQGLMFLTLPLVRTGHFLQVLARRDL